MSVSRVADLPDPVTAAKTDWLVASHWIGFTPSSDNPGSESQCQATINSQMAGGYVIEYITNTFGTPNAGFETSPDYLSQRQAHSEIAERLVAVHRLKPTARPLGQILGDGSFERLQDMWAEGGKRRRWSVAFPIVESYEIQTKPFARDILGPDAMRRVFAHPSATLRPLNVEERAALANLPLLPRQTSNAWIAIDDEIAAAERSQVDKKISREIGFDLNANAMEGMTAEQAKKIRMRAAWLAHKFVVQRQKSGTLICDDCGFDPATRTNGSVVRPRELLDVHHPHPMDEGVRVTTLADLALLCPNCHRLAHALLRASAAVLRASAERQ
jgi:5-methylcytosine-specific restriction enzyme A